MDVTDLHALGRHIATREDEALASTEGDEALRQRLARRAGDRPGRARSRSRRRRLVASLAVLSAAAMAAFVTLGAFSRALTFTVGDPARRGNLREWVSARADAAMPIVFSDGTRITLEGGARGRVVSVASRGAEFVLESGRAAVAVVPNERGDFRLRTGPFVVHVHGTRFALSWDPLHDAFSLALYEGHVTVSGCSFGSGRAVEPGETVRASCAEPAVSVARSDAEPAVSSPPTATDGRTVAPLPPTEAALPPTTVSSGRTAAATRSAADTTFSPPPPRDTAGAERKESWVELARGGLYERAYAAASAEGFSRALVAYGASEVLLLGDVARHGGHVAEARAAYEAVRERFPGSDAAANAAFALGRLAFDANHDASGAARWFEAYLAERPSGPLGGAALGRLLEARLALGQSDEARSVARRYVALHPNGPLAHEARRVLGSD